MTLILAAIRTGTDPIGKLPDAAIHTLLNQQLHCPKCDATYNLVCDYDASISRHFESESGRLIAMLRKAVFVGHFNDHKVSHFETSGVVVRSFEHPTPKPLTTLIQ